MKLIFDSTFVVFRTPETSKIELSPTRGAIFCISPVFVWEPQIGPLWDPKWGPNPTPNWPKSATKTHAKKHVKNDAKFGPKSVGFGGSFLGKSRPFSARFWDLFSCGLF